MEVSRFPVKHNFQIYNVHFAEFLARRKDIGTIKSIVILVEDEKGIVHSYVLGPVYSLDVLARALRDQIRFIKGGRVCFRLKLKSGLKKLSDWI